jgi:hypothetical protein
MKLPFLNLKRTDVSDTPISQKLQELIQHSFSLVCGSVLLLNMRNVQLDQSTELYCAAPVNRSPLKRIVVLTIRDAGSQVTVTLVRGECRIMLRASRADRD